MLSRPDIKFIQSLRLKKFRQEHGLFIAEGVKIVSELIQSSWMTDRIYLSSKGMALINPLLTDKKLNITEVSEKELGRISNQKNPYDALAVVKIPAAESADDMMRNIIEAAEKEMVLMLDDIQDPGNMGTIIRAADWFGITNIICSPGCVELYNPKVIQSTMGAFIRIKVLYNPLPDILDLDPSLSVTGAVMDGDNLYETRLPPHGFLVIGNESHGIGPKVLPHLSARISIPSPGTGTESLNASVATAVILAEYYRQNRELP